MPIGGKYGPNTPGLLPTATRRKISVTDYLQEKRLHHQITLPNDDLETMLKSCTSHDLFKQAKMICENDPHVMRWEKEQTRRQQMVYQT